MTKAEVKLIREAKELLEQSLTGKRHGVRDLTDQERFEVQYEAWRLITRALGEDPS